MPSFERLHAPVRHLSVDVALGSAITSRFLMQSVAYRVPLSHYGLLALAVWLIYAMDHTLDSYRLDESYAALPNRHTFFKQYRVVILPAMVVAAAALLAGVVYFHFPVWPNAWIVALPTLAYYLVDRWLRPRTQLLKSCFIACGFTLGLAIFFVTSPAFWMTAWPHMTAIFFLALYNIWIFQHQETDYDISVMHEKDKPHRLLRHRLGRKIPLVLMCLTLGLFVPQGSFVVMVGAMGALLLVCDLNERWFAQCERYRIVGDGIFLLPLLAMY